eukprot:TRINITY_DN2114_c0_g1_i1.p1 TRINITY_DN2114_c0_g1~~TRINITY_DN2114_c0_g1_i1.p1  ORF type:complete len:524 (+),score=160.25 TRINITY_DN2114_c0_g1_i1:128-1699(+)
MSTVPTNAGNSVKASLIAALRKDLEGARRPAMGPAVATQIKTFEPIGKGKREDVTPKRTSVTPAGGKTNTAKKENVETPTTLTPGAKSAVRRLTRDATKRTPVGRKTRNEKTRSESRADRDIPAPELKIEDAPTSEQQTESPRESEGPALTINVESTPIEAPATVVSLQSPKELGAAVLDKCLSVRALHFIIAAEPCEGSLCCLQALFALLAGHCAQVPVGFLSTKNSLSWDEAKDLLEKNIPELSKGLAAVRSLAEAGRLPLANIHAATRFVHWYNKRADQRSTLCDEVADYVLALLDLFFEQSSGILDNVIVPVETPIEEHTPEMHQLSQEPYEVLRPTVLREVSNSAELQREVDQQLETENEVEQQQVGQEFSFDQQEDVEIRTDRAKELVRMVAGNSFALSNSPIERGPQQSLINSFGVAEEEPLEEHRSANESLMRSHDLSNTREFTTYVHQKLSQLNQFVVEAPREETVETQQEDQTTPTPGSTGGLLAAGNTGLSFKKARIAELRRQSGVQAPINV